MASFIKFACVVVMCMALVGAPMVQAAVSCGQIVSTLSPCLGYLSQGGAPPADCCDGVKSVVQGAATSADRKATCNCLKSAAGAIGGYDDTNAVALPGKCGVQIPYKISTSTNCNNIN